MTQVCRPTPLVRFMHRSETSSKQLLYRMARAPNSGAFLPMILCHGTHRNALWLKTCKRTDGSLSRVRTPVNHHLPAGSAAFIPMHECGGLPPRYEVRKRFPVATIDGIVSVPPTKSGLLVETFARQVATQLGIEYVAALAKVRSTQEQKNFTNWRQKAENVNCRHSFTFA